MRARSLSDAARGLVLVAGLVVLLGAVAVTAGMGRPSEAAARGYSLPPQVLIAWGAAVALVAGLAASVLGPFWSRREKWTGLVMALLLLLGFLVLAERQQPLLQQVQQQQQQEAPPTPAAPVTPTPAESQPRPPAAQQPPARTGRTTSAIPAWLLTVIGAAALLLAALALRIGGGRRSAAAVPAGAAAALEGAVAASLEEIAAETDPRRAVVAAWMSMSEALARHGIARHPSEAALEYVQRALRAVHVRTDSVQRLTALFQRARYSDHPATAAMRDEALAALREVRDDLREQRR